MKNHSHERRSDHHRACFVAKLSSSINAVSFSSACTTKRFPLSRCASTIQIVRAVGTHVPSREVCHNGREYWDGTETLKSWGEKSLQSLVTLLRLAASEHQISFNELGRSGVGSGKGTLTKRRNK